MAGEEGKSANLKHDKSAGHEEVSRAQAERIIEDSHRFAKSKKILDTVHEELLKNGPPELDLKSG